MHSNGIVKYPSSRKMISETKKIGMSRTFMTVMVNLLLSPEEAMAAFGEAAGGKVGFRRIGSEIPLFSFPMELRWKILREKKIEILPIFWHGKVLSRIPSTL